MLAFLTFYWTLASTCELAFKVKVQDLALLPLLEHAPDQMASRPLVTLSVIEDPGANGATCATALIDRIIHHANVIDIEGQSYRLRQAESRAAAPNAPSRSANAAARSPAGSSATVPNSG